MSHFMSPVMSRHADFVGSGYAGAVHPEDPRDLAP